MSNYDETRNLVLRQGIHKAMVEVNEEGAEAAAVTALQRLGIEDLFTQQANLSKFDREGKLLATDAIHKAVVKVNEEGAEAAAVTAIIIGLSITSIPPPPRVFKCDRPFLFCIHDNNLDNILFMGVYRQPQQ
ncbi:Serine protease inhibitor-like [Homarus americanus]|uniref:Serine protease inhibitor-like n=1 Tax=Homarus americanus TaxID=6706 RepID=A0A8J5N603_HOMAM|nr:Serine protease inhibitor-like [Homarus americanus]